MQYRVNPMKLYFCLISFILHLLVHSVDGGTFTVDIPNQQFLKDGKPFRYISGEIHYFRIHPDQWEDRLSRVRASGLNAIQVYVAWNEHEPFEGQFDFSGKNNITRFLALAQQYELNVLLRAGPYICSEWDFGGLPWWLIKYEGIKLRTYNTDYLNAIQNFYNIFLPIIKPYLYQNGGPIIMVQVENEYGMWGDCNYNYTIFLRDLFRNNLGNDAVLYTSKLNFFHTVAQVDREMLPISDPPAGINGNKTLTCGNIAGTFKTVDFGVQWNNNSTNEYFAMQQNINGGGPKVDTEIYPGWNVVWGNVDPAKGYPGPQAFLTFLQYIYSLNASFSIYMFHGGTNFGFMNGQDLGNTPGDITSYDFNAPIYENGAISPLYEKIHDWLQNLPDWEQKPQPIPANNTVLKYGQVTLTKLGSSLISTLNLLQEPCFNSKFPLSFEQIDHGYGFVIYTTTLTAGGKILSSPHIKDYGYVFVNNVYQGNLSRDNFTSLTLTYNANAGDVLKILVENRGRLKSGTYVDSKGLFNVTLDNVQLQNWVACGVNLTKSSVESLTNSLFDTFDKQVLPGTQSPGVYTGKFTANQIEDTFFDPTGWTKGQLFINGYNLGRYWPTMGPQVTLYVPKPVLQQINTVVLIELQGAQQNYVSFTDTPISGYQSGLKNN